MAMSNAQRQAAYMERLRARIAPGKPARKPKDRRSAPVRWADAVAVLDDLLAGWQVARDNLPASLAETPYGEKLDAILEHRDAVDAMLAAECPKGFGRD